jgi:hypothetical protein
LDQERESEEEGAVSRKLKISGPTHTDGDAAADAAYVYGWRAVDVDDVSATRFVGKLPVGVSSARC